MNVSFSKSWDRHLFRSPIICRHLSLSEIRCFCKFLLLSQNWHKCRRIPQNARLTYCEQSGANFKTVSLSLFVKDFLVQISVISKLFRLTDKTQNAARVKEYRRREIKMLCQITVPKQPNWILIWSRWFLEMDFGITQSWFSLDSCLLHCLAVIFDTDRVERV